MDDDGAPAHPIAIRPFEERDRADVVRLARELQAHEHALFDRMKPAGEIGDWYLDDLLDDCRRHDGMIVVAELAGQIVGYAAVMASMSSEEDVDETDYRFAYCRDVAVTQRARGRGIGTRLLDACEAYARARGARWLRISAIHDNARTVELYRRRGFRPLFITLEKPLGSDGGPS